MGDKILFVDDEPAVLDGIRRMLHRDYEVDTAVDGATGLASVQAFGPYSIVVSDMRMPTMNGAQFLARVRQRAPDTVRMLLTGYTDIGAAIDAVNEANIFRFLTKPCEKEVLISAIKIGLDQYHAITAEKKLAEKARLVERSAADPATSEICVWDNWEGATGLPGPSQARSYLLPLLGVDPHCYVVMLRITMLQIIEQRYGEEAGRDYLNFAAQSLVQSFRSEDRFFHWGRDVLMAVVRRQFAAAALRMEVARVTSAEKEQMMTVKGKSIMIGRPVAYDLLPVSQYEKLDDMLMAFDARAAQNSLMGKV